MLTHNNIVFVFQMLNNTSVFYFKKLQVLTTFVLLSPKKLFNFWTNICTLSQKHTCNKIGKSSATSTEQTEKDDVFKFTKLKFYKTNCLNNVRNYHSFFPF